MASNLGSALIKSKKFVCFVLSVLSHLLTNNFAYAKRSTLGFRVAHFFFPRRWVCVSQRVDFAERPLSGTALTA